jgi:predicted  nucleic acid-binding Zn-ribbon protein
MLDDVAILRDQTMEPSLDELQDSIEQLTAYRERLENDVKAMGQKLRMPQKKIQAAVADHAELQRLGEILEQLSQQRDAMTSKS